MPHIPCPISITCGSPDEVDDPLSNFSSELPDVIRFGATGWVPPTIDPGLPPGDPPVVPNGYIAQGCVSICFSSISQEEANLCAANQALLCGFGQGGCNGSVCPTSFLPLTPARMFFNQVQQCTYTCPDGTLFITTVGAGTFAASTQAEADQVAHDYACGIASNSFICLSNLASETCLGSAYSSTVTAIGGNLPLTFSIVSGALPPGLSMSSGLDGKSFTISGITMIAGVYAFQIKVNDATGHTAFKVFTIKVTGIDNLSVPSAQVGVAYSQTLTAASMTLPLIWSISAGALPAGLTLNSASGTIFGTPTTAGTDTFTIQCTDGAGLACTRQYVMTVNPALACPVADGTVALADPFGTFPYFCQYAPSLEVAHPNKYFSSISDGMDEVDADTKAFIRTTLYGGNLFILSQNAVFSPVQRRVYFSVQDTGTSDIFIKAIDVTTQAITSSAVYPAPTTALWRLVYDAVHDQVATTKDTALASFLVILNSATLAEISSVQIATLAAGERARHLTYDPVRDRYWVTIFNGGGTPILLRVFDRSTGAKLLEIHVTDIDDLGIAYGAATDKIYYRRASVVPLAADLLEIRNAGTGALEDTITITGCIGGLWAVYDSARELIWCNNGSTTFFGVSTASKTMACTMAGLRYSPGFFGSKIAVRGPAPGPMNFFV